MKKYLPMYHQKYHSSITIKLSKIRGKVIVIIVCFSPRIKDIVCVLSRRHCTFKWKHYLCYFRILTYCRLFRIIRQETASIMMVTNKMPFIADTIFWQLLKFLVELGVFITSFYVYETDDRCATMFPHSTILWFW